MYSLTLKIYTYKHWYESLYDKRKQIKKFIDHECNHHLDISFIAERRADTNIGLIVSLGEFRTYEEAWAYRGEIMPKIFKCSKEIERIEWLIGQSVYD